MQSDSGVQEAARNEMRKAERGRKREREREKLNE